MSPSSTATDTPVCGNCGARRSAADFRCPDCGKILPSMLQMPTLSPSRGAPHGTTPRHTPSSSGVTSDVNIFKRLFTAQGRLGRLQYFQYLLANLVLFGVQTLFVVVVLLPMISSLIQPLMEPQLSPEAAAQISFGPFLMGGLLALGVSLFLVCSYCCLASQRSHDLGKPGTYCLFSFVPLLNIYWAFRWVFSEGQRGANTYGPDPLG